MKTTEIPLFIACTGHRDLETPEKIRRELCGFFTLLKQNLPDTVFYLMSGLASGADQIFTACGKEILADKAEIFAVLPFSRDEYRKDFAGDDLEFYDKSVCGAKKIVELPGSRSDESAAYMAVGKYLADNANILIAVWDGNIPYTTAGEKICGGTADTVDIRLNYERKHPEALFSSYRTVDVIKITAERKANSSRVDRKYTHDAKIGSGEIIEWTDATPEMFMKYLFRNRNAGYAFKQIDIFNSLCRKEDPSREISGQYLGIADKTGVEELIDRFSVLDAFANFVQKKYIHQFNIIFLLSLVLGIFAQIYGGIDHNFLSFSRSEMLFRPVTWTLPLYFILFVMLYLYSFFQKRSGCDNKYLDYRALAEALRVDMFWKIAGVNANAGDHFMIKSESGLEWTSIALQNWKALDVPEQGNVKNTTDVLKAWVIDQQKYYDKKSRFLAARARKINLLAKGFFIFSFIAGIIFLVDTFAVTIFPDALSRVLYAVNGITVGIGSFLMATLMFLIEKKGWESTSDSYRHNEKLFSHILEKVKDADAETVRIYLEFLGKEALKEHEQWLLNSRQRKPEPNV